MSTIKIWLAQPESVFNGVEVYARYYYIDSNGTYHYSKWTHYYDNLAKPEGSTGSQLDDKENMFTENQSETGLTPDDFEKLENSGNSRNDTDATQEYIFETDNITKATENFFDMLQGMFNGMGQFPALLSTVFGYMPSWLFSIIALALTAIIILRFIGR